MTEVVPDPASERGMTEVVPDPASEREMALWFSMCRSRNTTPPNLRSDRTRWLDYQRIDGSKSLPAIPSAGMRFLRQYG